MIVQPEGRQAQPVIPLEPALSPAELNGVRFLFRMAGLVMAGPFDKVTLVGRLAQWLARLVYTE